MIFIGNKIDLVERIEVSEEEGKAFALMMGKTHFSTSVKNRINVSESIEHLAKLTLRSNSKIPVTFKKNEKIHFFIGTGSEQLIQKIFKIEFTEFEVPKVNKLLSKNVWSIIFKMVLQFNPINKNELNNLKLVCKFWYKHSNIFKLDPNLNSNLTKMKPFYTNIGPFISSSYYCYFNEMNIKTKILLIHFLDLENEIEIAGDKRKILSCAVEWKKELNLTDFIIFHGEEDLKKKYEKEWEAKKKEVLSSFEKYKILVCDFNLDIHKILEWLNLPQKNEIRRIKKPNVFGFYYYLTEILFKRDYEHVPLSVLEKINAMNEKKLKELNDNLKNESKINYCLDNFIFSMNFSETFWTSSLKIENKNKFSITVSIDCANPTQKIFVKPNKFTLKKNKTIFVEIEQKTQISVVLFFEIIPNTFFKKEKLIFIAKANYL